MKKTISTGLKELNEKILYEYYLLRKCVRRISKLVRPFAKEAKKAF
jgi:hypothetical protein